MTLDKHKKYTLGSIILSWGWMSPEDKGWTDADLHYSFHSYQMEQFARDGLLTEYQAPKVIKGEHNTVSHGPNTIHFLPELPEGEWRVEYTITEIL